MKILGIDTSCDDTCVALLEIRNSKLKILSNIVSSQVKLHAKYGGVYPALAKREHQKNLPIVFKKALKETNSSIFNFQFLISKQNLNYKIKNSKIDFIAVTVGPGLEPCLWQGINFSKELAKKYKKPIIPINHIEAHIIANFLNSKSRILNSKYLFPAVCLVASGGHTQLILMNGLGKYKLIGETRDDAAGECFDKTARILGLSYPGGPIIAKLAQQHDLKIKNLKLKISLSRPMMYTKDYDFSFSGLKTAVLYDFRSRSPKIRKSKEYVQAMCREIQQSIIDVLIHKTMKAAKDFKAKSIILGGGVAANDELRKQFELKLAETSSHLASHSALPSSAIKNLKLKINFFVPEKIFCTDNAAMIAATAYFHQKEATKNWQKIKVNANLKI